MIKDFLRYIYESKYDAFSEEVVRDIIKIISNNGSSIIRRRSIKEMEYSEPVSFSLILSIFRSSSFEPEKITVFSSVPWEKINFENNGFAVDANSFVPSDVYVHEPEVQVNIILNPNLEPKCYEALQFKLLDCIRHEIEHLLQKGFNVQPEHTGRQVDKNRKFAQSSYLYFILPDEMPAMVSGMRLSAEKKGKPIDTEFEEYLSPIRDSGFISDDELTKVMNAWIKFTIKHFPDAQISKKYRIR
jgi:hypothetical protein